MSIDNNFSLPTIHPIYPLIPIIFLAWPSRRKRTGSDTVARGDASHGSNDMFDLGKTHGESYTSEAARRPSTRGEAGLTTCTTINELKRIVCKIQLLLITSEIHDLATAILHHNHATWTCASSRCLTAHTTWLRLAISPQKTLYINLPCPTRTPWERITRGHL